MLAQSTYEDGDEIYFFGFSRGAFTARSTELQNRRLILGVFPWKFQGGEAAFARVVAFDGEWPANP